MDKFSLEVGAAAGAIGGFLLGFGLRAWLSWLRRRRARGF